MGGEGYMGFGGGFMWILWILIIVFIIWAVKSTVMTNSSGQSNDETPQDILKKRFARGEIDEAEYERRRKELQK